MTIIPTAHKNTKSPVCGRGICIVSARKPPKYFKIKRVCGVSKCNVPYFSTSGGFCSIAVTDETPPCLCAAEETNSLKTQSRASWTAAMKLRCIRVSGARLITIVARCFWTCPQIVLETFSWKQLQCKSTQQRERERRLFLSVNTEVRTRACSVWSARPTWG